MILSRPEILKLIKQGKVKITPFNSKNVGAGSVDLTLGNIFRIFKKNVKPFHVKEDVFEKYKLQTKLIKVNPKKGYKLKHDEMILGITKENIELPENICGWLQGRTRFARIGLLVHVSSGFVHPGVNNKQVLEIINMAPFPLIIYPRVKVCQLILEEVKGKARFSGFAQYQKEP